MKHEELEIRATDGTPLHVERWSPDKDVRCVIVAVHGASGHMGRHAWLAELLESDGGLVVGPDHRGQGLSGGPRGHVERFEDYAADLRLVMERTAEDLPVAQRPDVLPWFLYGHSMGGLVALTYLLDHEQPIALRGAIVSSPLLGLALRVNRMKRLAGELLAKLLPNIALPAGIPPELICRDPVQVARYAADERRVSVVSAGWFAAMHHAIERVETEIAKLALPMRWAVGSGDAICDHQAVLRVFRSLDDAQAKDQTLRIWDGYYHELHHEPGDLGRLVREDYRAWILERCPD